MAEHSFHLNAEWPGGRNTVGSIEAGNLKTEISIPPEMNGPGIGTNPDEMLLGAAATCYIITLAAKLERANIVPEEMSLSSEGIVEVDDRGVITYRTIIHRPYVKADAAFREKIERYMDQSEQSCMISRALKGNVEIRLEKHFEAV
ncbi:SACOL1771 family peroxiredoxin [Jeotgalibacillus haloalkalitolerans]|uniref:SACOL1771 family peroxiredoxin n=1 Tax=Jeotgalibacillus haloalkalitolerans TaxID=3104292 RepID=A0ABU5KQD6_9BACL|nr:SACOL1771 family peroxiredoxin [Jeotgalibacillus sp. HH7-29]MDZ5712966.1 SACOL1771 family peroxiredoxin [Jeotgalibacillus sp. HH7-29]